MPPGTFRSRSFTRFTMRVGFPHLGQSVLLDVSIIFLRSAVLATLAMVQYSPVEVNAVVGQSGLYAVPLLLFYTEATLEGSPAKHRGNRSFAFVCFSTYRYLPILAISAFLAIWLLDL